MYISLMYVRDNFFFFYFGIATGQLPEGETVSEGTSNEDDEDEEMATKGSGDHGLSSASLYHFDELLTELVDSTEDGEYKWLLLLFGIAMDSTSPVKWRTILSSNLSVVSSSS